MSWARSAWMSAACQGMPVQGIGKASRRSAGGVRGGVDKAARGGGGEGSVSARPGEYSYQPPPPRARTIRFRAGNTGPA